MATSVDALVRQLNLEPHPEGGWYKEIYRSTDVVHTPRGARSAITTIYYLLAAGQCSRWHVVASDEIWHFYRGAPLELITYTPAQRHCVRHELSGLDGARHIAAVPAGTWQAARPLGDYALVGCTVGPGFAFEDFRFVSSLPDHQEHFAGPLSTYASLL